MVARSFEANTFTPEQERIKHSVVQTFRELVQIPSSTGHEAQISAHLARWLTQRGFSVDQDERGNILTRVSGKGRPLLLSAHMDTVLEAQPIHPVIGKDGIIRSRGKTILGADDKGPMAAMLTTMEGLIPLAGNHRALEVVFTTGEESDYGLKLFDTKKLDARDGIIADCSGELGGIIGRSPAYVAIDYHLVGRSAHAAFPHRGLSVLPAIGEITSTVKTGEVEEETYVNIAPIEVGSSRNTIPGEADLRGEARGFNVGKVLSQSAKVDEIIFNATKKRGIKIQGGLQFWNEAYTHDPQNPFIQHIMETFRTIGIEPTLLYDEKSCSDANIFNSKKNAAGEFFNVVVIRDGTQNTHTSRESIAIKDLVSLVNIYTTLAKAA